MRPIYIFDSFPMVWREDESRFGTYYTRDMTLAYVRAFKAGDTQIKSKFRFDPSSRGKHRPPFLMQASQVIWY